MDGEMLAIVLLVCAAGLANGGQYPAGVDPQSCPNYPNCDNAALHGSRGAASTGNTWNSVAPVPTAGNANWESWGSASRWNAPAPAAAASPAVAAQYPAGVNPQSCPNYPNCDNAALHGGAFAPGANSGSWGSLGSGGPTAGWNAASNGHARAPAAAPQYPAGVNAQSCPNYPYCY